MKKEYSKCPQCGKTIDEVKNETWEAWNYCCRSYFDTGLLKDAKEQGEKKTNEKRKKGG